MATQDQHDGIAPSGPTSTAEQAAALTVRGASRRRFAKAAGAGAGVILTLTSQPGMATTVCACPSQSLSLTHSGRPGQTPVCAGRLPSYWKSNTAWPGTVTRETTTSGSTTRTATKCSDVFYCSTIPQYGSTTLLKMLDPCSFDTYEIGAHLVAAYLNVLSGLVTFMKVQDVTNIWRELATSGVYKPSAGVVWQPYDVVEYLKKTMS